MSPMKKVMANSHPNIAIIKYWGKDNIKDNTCSTPSISFSLTKLTTTTTITYSESMFFYLNGIKQTIPPRMKNVIYKFQVLGGDNRNITVKSNNNFPDSCGFASSASGFSALVKALNLFYNTNLNEKELSIVSRMCSGSASRSIPKGIVFCNKEFSISLGEWPEIKIFYILVSSNKKMISSTKGMLITQETSCFYKDRLTRINDKIEKCKEAIVLKDFPTLCQIIIRESNELHGMMFESYPPIRYINDEGYKIMSLINEHNQDYGFSIAYTFDAGPNPFIITLEENVKLTKQVLNNYELIECN